MPDSQPDHSGEPLTDFHGVMTGVPQYVGSSGPLMNKDGHAGR
jgi:hypothetical protein